MSKEISSQITDDMLKQIEKISQSLTGLSNVLVLFNAKGAVEQLEKFVNKSLLTGLDELQIDLQNCANNISDDLKTNITELKNSQDEIKMLQNAYQGVANYNNLPNELEAFLIITDNSLKEIQNETKLEVKMDAEIKPLIENMLLSVLDLGTNVTNGIVEKTIPCKNIHYAYVAFVSTWCSNSGLLTRFFGWALALTLSILFAFLALMGTCNLWYMQSHQISRLYTN